MASLTDLQTVMQTNDRPAGFTLANIGIADDMSQRSAEVGMERSARNFTQRYLPDMLGNQGSRGAYNSSATINKAARGVEDFGDTLSDLADRAGRAGATLSTNALLAQTGIQL